MRSNGWCSALSVLAGMEAMTALRDVCRLSAEEALAVTDWAARALVDAALDVRA
jgi:hypothetical protein